MRVAPVDAAEDIIDVSDLHEYPQWLVMTSDPEAERPRPAPGDLRTAYGETVSEIAARQDLAVDTARKRLKAVFEKTRTHRQAELVQRVLSDFGGL